MPWFPGRAWEPVFTSQPFRKDRPVFCDLSSLDPSSLDSIDFPSRQFADLQK